MALEVLEERQVVIRVLVVDDALNWTEEIRLILESIEGVQVYCVDNLTAASAAIAEHQFELVSVDVRFPHDNQRGDAWLLEHWDKLGSATKLLVTGAAEFMANAGAVRDKGVTIIPKKTNPSTQRHERQELERIARALVSQKDSEQKGQAASDKRRGFESVRGLTHKRRIPQDEVVHRALGVIRELFREWLVRASERQVSGKDGEAFVGGQRVDYSKVLEDWDGGSPLGEYLLEAFAEDMQRQITIQNKLSRPQPRRSDE